MLIIVSGASTGIGRAIVEACLEDGHDVIAGVRNLSALADLTPRFPRLRSMILDVTKPDEIARLGTEVLGDQRIVLINNAGVATGGPVEAVSMMEWRKAFDVNVFGLIELTQALLPHLRRTKGLVINVGSVSGRVSPPYLGTYSATKFAVRAVSDSLRRELAPFGVQVSLLEPGPIQTPIWQKSLEAGAQMRATFSPEMDAVYGPYIQGVVDSVKMSEKSAVPVSHVTRKVLHAIHSKDPRPYYPIGKFMTLMRMMLAVVPTAMLDKMLAVNRAK